jgi:hypothetical protein
MNIRGFIAREDIYNMARVVYVTYYVHVAEPKETA